MDNREEKPKQLAIFSISDFNYLMKNLLEILTESDGNKDGTFEEKARKFVNESFTFHEIQDPIQVGHTEHAVIKNDDSDMPDIDD